MKLLTQSFYIAEIFVCYVTKRVKLYDFTRKLSSRPKSVKAIKMAYKKFVDADVKDAETPIIIMHGLFGSKSNWSSLGGSILKATNKVVYAVDARNHGDSPHTDEHSYFHLAEDIKSFVSDLNVKKAALIGHSMGGRGVMAFALRYPQAVESITVVDISPVDVNDSMKEMFEIIEALRAVKFNDISNLSEARRSAQNQLIRMLGSGSLAGFLTMNVTEKAKGEFGWKINVETISKEYETQMLKFPIKDGEFDGPTLFVIGGKSDFVNIRDADQIKKIFPKAIFETIADAGHLVHVERPKEFLQVVCDFIRKSVGNKLT